MNPDPTTASQGPPEPLCPPPRTFPDGFYLIDPDERFAFCMIPKCACRTVARWFMQAVGDQTDVASPSIINHCYENHAPLLADKAAGERLLDQCFRTVFIRDPLKRIASAFVDKFVLSPPEQHFLPAWDVFDDVAHHEGVRVVRDSTRTVHFGTKQRPVCSAVNYAAGITFRQFVLFLNRTSSGLLDQHWRPQIDFLAGRSFHFIGRTETMSPSLNALATRFGLDIPPLELVKPAADRPGMGRNLADVTSTNLYERLLADNSRAPSAADLYDDELEDIVRTRYASDLMLRDHASDEPADPPHAQAFDGGGHTGA